MPPVSKRLLRAAEFTGLALLLALAITSFLHRPSLRVVAEWPKPANVRYRDDRPYYLSVVESDIDWRAFPLHVERNYFLYVGHDSQNLVHGHVVKFSFETGGEDVEPYIKKCSTEWSPLGVTFKTPLGHTVFIPRDMFVGGR